MNITKKVVGQLDKCYSMATLTYKNKKHFLVAAEKVDECRMYDLDGNFEEVIWEEPGGVMTMVQVPGTDGQFLATHRFYSPNDSANASIVLITPRENAWEVRTLVDLPFVHRFDVLERNGVRYLIACALKSGHQQKDDWSSPGKVYAAVLPEDLSAFDKENQLKLEVIQEGMLKNHGYYRHVGDTVTSAIVSCEQGVFQFTPPTQSGAAWDIQQLLGVAASDAVLMDIDGDGDEELLVLEPFHGASLAIYKLKDGKYQKHYQHEEKLEFLHGMFGGEVCGKPRFIVGHRNGERKLLSITSDGKGGYEIEELDAGCGAANLLHYYHNDKDVLLATNREIDEIAMYTLE